MTKGSTVYGHVKSTSGEVIPSAHVVCAPGITSIFSPLQSPQAFRSEKTDKLGAFTITDLPAGNFQLLAQHDDYKFQVTGSNVYADGYSDIDGVVLNLTPVESGEFTIYGTVTDNNGSPIDGVQLNLVIVGLQQITRFS